MVMLAKEGKILADASISVANLRPINDECFVALVGQWFFTHGFCCCLDQTNYSGGIRFWQ